LIIKAKYALLGPGDVRQNVRLEYDGKRILSIRDGYAPGGLRTDYDFGLACITPGFINSHTHMELEFLAGAVPFDGSFVGWLQQIRDVKRQRNNELSSFPEASLRSLAACGCTTIVDHHTVPLDWRRIRRAGLRYYPMREFFEFNNHGPDPALMAEQAEFSYAPHAPYTASLEVAQACRRLANEAGRPISMHLSEFRGEIDFIKTGHDAEIDELTRRAGVESSQWKGTGLSSIQYAAQAGLLDGPSFMVHVNYLDEGDLEVLVEKKPTVVYCPRSHHFFKHPEHPLPRLIAAGVPVALGSDSLASNDSLSPLAEAAFVRQRFPQIPVETVFRMATSAGLVPLGLQRDHGRLQPGQFADLAVYPLPLDPGDSFADLFDVVLEVGESCFTVCDGQTVWNPKALTIAA
jgi:cytosine/adenosine deaminase-related metal-dependent hydrolase